MPIRGAPTDPVVSVRIGSIAAALEPIKGCLKPFLIEAMVDQQNDGQQRMFAAESLVEYFRDDTEIMLEMLLDCDGAQFELAYCRDRCEYSTVGIGARQITKQHSPNDVRITHPMT